MTSKETVDEIRVFRESLGLGQERFGALVGLRGENINRTVRRWEDYERDIPGSVILLVKIFQRFPAALKLAMSLTEGQADL